MLSFRLYLTIEMASVGTWDEYFTFHKFENGELLWNEYDHESFGNENFIQRIFLGYKNSCFYTFRFPLVSELCSPIENPELNRLSLIPTDLLLSSILCPISLFVSESMRIKFRVLFSIRVEFFLWPV